MLQNHSPSRNFIRGGNNKNLTVYYNIQVASATTTLSLSQNFICGGNNKIINICYNIQVASATATSFPKRNLFRSGNIILSRKLFRNGNDTSLIYAVTSSAASAVTSTTIASTATPSSAKNHPNLFRSGPTSIYCYTFKV
jgi:hypothetical protein